MHICLYFIVYPIYLYYEGMLQGRVFLKVGLTPLPHMRFIDKITPILNDKDLTLGDDNIYNKCVNITKDSIYDDNLDKELKAYILNHNNNHYNDHRHDNSDVNKIINQNNTKTKTKKFKPKYR